MLKAAKSCFLVLSLINSATSETFAETGRWIPAASVGEEDV
jgi:hypothetical protein